MEKKHILAIDQGTTSSRALVVDARCNIVTESHIPLQSFYPRSAWVEQNPLEIWFTVEEAVGKAILEAGITPDDIASIGITNQRETCIVWDRLSGEPVYNAIVWQDRRTAAFCEKMKREGLTNLIRDKTGLIIDPYFSAAKIRWILENVDGAREKAQHGDLIFGTVDTWLIWKLTGGKRHITDPSNASRTMLFNIHSMRWDEELLQLFGIPACMLPEVVQSSGESDTYAEISGFLIPVAGIAGDQQAALFGQLCTEVGMTKATYGTGCFVMMNTGAEPVVSDNNMLSTVAWQIGGERRYALEGSVFVGGAAVQWLRDGLGIISSSEETYELAASVPDTNGVCFVPALTGLGAPYWDPQARGTIVGLTRGTTKAHIVRATLEAIAYQVQDVLAAMQSDTDTEMDIIKVDGGAVRNEFLTQFQADISQLEVVRTPLPESSAMGAAFLAGLASGLWENTEEIAAHLNAGTSFNPSIPGEESEKLLDRWHKAVGRSLAWAEE